MQSKRFGLPFSRIFLSLLPDCLQSSKKKEKNGTERKGKERKKRYQKLMGWLIRWMPLLLNGELNCGLVLCGVVYFLEKSPVHERMLGVWLKSKIKMRIYSIILNNNSFKITKKGKKLEIKSQKWSNKFISWVPFWRRTSHSFARLWVSFSQETARSLVESDEER